MNIKEEIVRIQEWLEGGSIPNIDLVGLQERDTMIANKFSLVTLMTVASTENYLLDRLDDLFAAISLCCEDDTLREEGVSREFYDQFILENQLKFSQVDKRISLAADFCEEYLGNSDEI